MRKIRLDLEPLKKVLTDMGSPHLEIPVISVAGTNGKGSVCAFLDSIMDKKGLKTGLYTSPHFRNLLERIKCGRRSISSGIYSQLEDRIHAAEEKSGEKLTEFEFSTAAAILYFNMEKCDLNIMETGMGGRLDATNVCLNKKAAVITSIDIDHSEFLGETKEEIAKEKAGIITNSAPVIDASGTDAVEREAVRKGAPVKKYGRDFDALNIKKAGDNGLFSFDYISGKVEIKELIPSLRGIHQCCNAAAAVAAAFESGFSVSEDDIRNGLKDVCLQGRLQFIGLPDGKTAILDTAHNPAACRSVAEFVRQHLPPERRLFTVAGMLKDKKYREMMAILEQVSYKIFTFTPPSERGLEGKKLAGFGSGARGFETFKEAYGAVLEIMQPGEAMLVCGSFASVSAALDALRAGRNKRNVC